MIRHTLGLSLLAATLTLCCAAVAPAGAQQTFSATYTGVANNTGPDANGFLHVTSSLHDPLASFGLTEALFNQTVLVFANPNVIQGVSTFQPTGGIGPDKLFTSYSGIGTPLDPANGVVVTHISGVFTVTGGTGAFADASGQGTWAGQANVATTEVSVNFTGTVVPEPGTPALLVGLSVSSIAMAARRRRH